MVLGGSRMDCMQIAGNQPEVIISVSGVLKT